MPIDLRMVHPETVQSIDFTTRPTPQTYGEMTMSRWVRWIDALNERLGKSLSWLLLAMILIGAFNAVVRYLGRFTGWNISSNAYLELQWYLFSIVFLLGAAYALRRDAHVRVDVLFSRMPVRVRHHINLWGALVFLIPFTIFSLIVCWPSVHNSWRLLEQSSDPGGLPRYPIKTVIPIAFVLLLLQAISEAYKSAQALRELREKRRAGEKP